MKTESLGPQLLTHHNLAYMMRLTRAMRTAIIEGKYESFVQQFLAIIYPPTTSSITIPNWVIDALAAAGIAASATK
jgi:queuine tRNA-ribosyltransferase